MPVACFRVAQIGIACERTRLLHLWGEPFVLAAADQTVQVAADEAARFGIQSGQSLAGARSLCANLVVLPYDAEAYQSAAQLLWDVYAMESSFVEPVSAEECFVELEGREALERAQYLCLAIAERVRVPVCVGLARTRILARQAALQRQETGVTRIEAAQEAELLAAAPLDAFVSLPVMVAQRLARLGVATLGDIRRLPAHELSRLLPKAAWLLQRLAHGEGGEPVRACWPPRRLERGITFEYEVCDLALVQHALGAGAEWLSSQLRQGNEYCRTLALRIRLIDGSLQEEVERLSAPLAQAEALQSAFLRLLSRIRLEHPVVELRLSASDLGIGSGLQLTLLDAQGPGYPHERRQRLETALAFLQRRYGVGAVVPLALLHQARRIHLWTHSLTRHTNEPIQVAVNGHGMPVRFYRGGKRFEVQTVQNRWREADWWGNTVVTTTAFRVETEPAGLYELHHIGKQWRLGALMD